MKNVLTCILIAALGLLLSCTYIKQRISANECKFTIVSIDIRSFSLTGITLGLSVNITNPNKIDVVIDKMVLDLYIKDTKTVNVTFNEVTIAPKNTKTVSADLVIPYSIIGMSMIDEMKNKGEIQYRLAGMAYMNTRLGVVKYPVTISRN
jgi:LEA14-like dessication related protein